MTTYPFIFTPDFKERVWGGKKLQTFFNKDIPYEHTGESWEVASHDNGQSIICNGELKGMTLNEVINKYPIEIIGHTLESNYKFPLLIKLIDAKEKLSVQVHPDDNYAKKVEHGELGKSEAWYVLEADEGAKLIAGLKDEVDKATFVKALENNNLETVLNEVRVQKGDVIDIPAGFVHAIGGGILLAEVQQNSDTTYRVYDWNRVGLDGNKRELHVDKSLDVIDFEGKHSKSLVSGISIEKDGYIHKCYISNEYFSLEKITVLEKYAQDNKPNRFEVFICIDGHGIVQYKGIQYSIKKGDSMMIPAHIKQFNIQGKVELLKTYVPANSKTSMN